MDVPRSNRRARSRDALGAHYVSTKTTDLADVGPFDIVVEAAGNAQLMLDALGLLGRSGVACLLGIDGRKGKAQIDEQRDRRRRGAREPRALRQRQRAPRRLGRPASRRSTARGRSSPARSRS